MDSAYLNNTNLMTLKQAAEMLSVSPNTLLSLNEYNILKPTITLSGEIGYTKEQIDHFLKIQQISGQTNSEYLQKPQIAAVHQLATQSISQKADILLSGSLTNSNATQDITGRDYISRRHYKTNAERFIPFLKISSFSFVFFTLIFLLPKTQGSTKLQNDHVAKAYQSPVTDAVAPQPSGSFIVSPQINLKNKVLTADNLHDESVNNPESNAALLSKVFDKSQIQPVAQDTNEPTPDIPLPEQANESGSRPELKKFTSFASSPSCSTCFPEAKTATNSVFDNNGKIKGETPKTNLLASTALNSNGINQADIQSKQNTNPLFFVAFLSLGLLSVISVFKNLPARTAYRANLNQIRDFSFQSVPEVQKVFEVSQKTDGTVALRFNGLEHKISKPELDSESDQFISKLMEMVKDDVKEIDYDTLNDDNIRFNTPLSKLVTRLGFVGIKRDLFFPRTSKNKVLFRKYVTQNDLISMGLTTEQISSQF